jgi:hypothetical protein
MQRPELDALAQDEGGRMNQRRRVAKTRLSELLVLVGLSDKTVSDRWTDPAHELVKSDIRLIEKVTAFLLTWVGDAPKPTRTRQRRTRVDVPAKRAG